MESKNMVFIKCRGVILHEGKLFVVKHAKHADFYAMPGGKLEVPESPCDCIEREIIEEFGVIPEIGKLLYVNNYIAENYDGAMCLEFFFEIKNSKDYLDINKLAIQKEEIFEIRWVSKDENIKILPEKIFEDFKNGTIGSQDVQFVK